MKKKLKVFLVVILGFSLVFSYVRPTRADSGWDADYGGGSSSSGGSSGSSWSGSSSSGSSSGGSQSSSSASDNNFIVVLIIVLIILYDYSKKRSGNNYSTKPISEAALSVEEIRKVLPDFDYLSFKAKVFDIYKNVQVAWMDFDYETMRKLTTDTLYNLYHSQLEALKLKGQKNIMSNFELVKFWITGIERNGTEVAIKTAMTVRCKDYVVSNEGKVLRGTSLNTMVYNYEMTFIKGVGTKDNKCPNCNAPLENVQSSVCPYCDSVIVGETHDWVLSKKEMKSQRRAR